MGGDEIKLEASIDRSAKGLGDYIIFGPSACWLWVTTM